VSFSFSAVVGTRGFDVSLTLGPGETLAVLGPNGAGKSTLLAVVAGLLRPDSGHADLVGRRLFSLDSGAGHWTAPHRRGTALLAQEPLLFPHLSVVDNVAFGPRSAGKTRAASRGIARHWLAEVDAGPLALRYPNELSGGQAQRVAVARALAANPELLLLDEPMGALDIHAAPLLRRLLKRVLAGRRAIIVTHDLLDALMLADRVLVLDNGRVAEEGPAKEVLQQPRTAFAAGLAGLNLLSGTLTGNGLRSDGGLELAGHRVDGGTPGDKGIAVFPPSAVSVFTSAAHGSPRNNLPVVITELEPHGDQIRVRAGALAADITPAASAELALVPGMPVFFMVKAAAVSIYPA
jgi:molybdate transport system ATP-binding protein